jgi:hypothetical protein
MKKTDIAMIILIAGVSVFLAYLITSSLPIFSSANKPVTVKTASPITSDVGDPDPKVFTKDAINPTVEVIIGNGTSNP